MADTALTAPRAQASLAPTLFAGAILTSAALLFFVQPMIAKMILPKLGGSPAVWNASMAFFQAMLLVGYGYAHLLQRLRSLRMQVVVHVFALAAAAMFLPLKVSQALGEPDVTHPIGWLLGVLFISVGAPFAVLSATAPLLQAWYAKMRAGSADAENPYVLYAASNLGSLVALLAYPVLAEPLLALQSQSLSWAGGYVLFTALVAAIAVLGWKISGLPELKAQAVKSAAPASWRERVTWVVLAALPSSLMLGLTTHISTDVASAPFLWVIPLALYLLTFVLAFDARSLVSPERARLWQTVFVTLAVFQLATHFGGWVYGLGLQVGAFFLTALVCHQALVARRPNASRLTEFYLCVSVGGVLGGSFNAFLAPILFDGVVEYPLVLVLALLARPFGGRASRMELAAAGVAGLAIVGGMIALDAHAPVAAWYAAVAVAVSASAVASRRAWLFAGILGALLLAPLANGARDTLHMARSFFGVHRVVVVDQPTLGRVHQIVHGNTLHGAQAMDPARQCTPGNYFVSEGAIAQVYQGVMSRRPGARFGVVGLGGGTVAAFMRKSDTLRFFEIDPVVERIAKDRRYFTYLSDCAKSPVDIVLGDARLTVAHEPPATYDLIHLDAFSSDSVPTHLLTVEALEGYFRALKPDGVLMLHISNRNVALEPSAAAAAKVIGATALMQNYRTKPGTPQLVANGSDVMVLSKSEAALAPFRNDPRWRPARDDGARAWTDDYTNVVGAIWAKLTAGRV